MLFRLQNAVASCTFIEFRKGKEILKCVIETLFLYAKMIPVIDQYEMKLLQERMITWKI